MYTIEVTLRGTPLALSVQRKEKDAAVALYKEVLTAMQSTIPKMLELTCDREADKQIGVFSNEISAVQVSDKSGGASGGRVPGFWAETSA